MYKLVYLPLWGLEYNRLATYSNISNHKSLFFYIFWAGSLRPGLNEKWLMVAMPQHPRLRITATEELAEEEKGGAHLELI